MEKDNTQHSGIVSSACEYAGVTMGTASALRKKATELGFKGAATMKNAFSRSVEKCATVSKELMQSVAKTDPVIHNVEQSTPAVRA